MDGAALIALFAAVGFGWQPMPDGSERYEYIVQVDEDLAATLASGKSIPIVGEVPDEIRPIGRVRVIVGPGDVPRERLATRLKPVVNEVAVGDAQKSIVVRGQDAAGQFPNNRYAAPSLPPAAQPLADAAAAAAATWNGAAAGSAAPTGSQLFDNASAAAESAWNQNVAAPAAEAFNSASQNVRDQLVAPVQQQINSAANQLQQGVGNLGQNFQGSAAALGDRTKSLIDEVVQPTARQPAQTSRDIRRQQTEAAAAVPMAAVPPPATGLAATSNPAGLSSSPVTSAPPASTWNQETPPASNPLRAADTPPPSAFSNDAPNEWNGQPSGLPATPPLAGETADAATNVWNSVGPPATAPLAGQPAASGASAPDPWQGVPDPRAVAAPPSSDFASGPTAPFRGMGWGAGDDASGSGAFGSPTTPTIVGPPSISGAMLNESPNRPLDGDASNPGGVAGLPAANPSKDQNSTPAPTVADIFAMNRQPVTNASTTPQTNQPATPEPTKAGEPRTSSGNNDNAIVTLVAWVLLFGSVFGNLYLFWSYLDVRQKYRALVRKTARAVGSRFSAA